MAGQVFVVIIRELKMSLSLDAVLVLFIVACHPPQLSVFRGPREDLPKGAFESVDFDCFALADNAIDQRHKAQLNQWWLNAAAALRCYGYYSGS